MDDNAVLVLLRKPALEFIRELRTHVDADSEYVKNHWDELFPKAQGFLLKGGIFWDVRILERDSMSILEQAIVRLQTNRKIARLGAGRFETRAENSTNGTSIPSNRHEIRCRVLQQISALPLASMLAH